jgi:hypothetical protein
MGTNDQDPKPRNQNEALSFTKAALQLRLAQPALSALPPTYRYDGSAVRRDRPGHKG